MLNTYLFSVAFRFGAVAGEFTRMQACRYIYYFLAFLDKSANIALIIWNVLLKREQELSTGGIITRSFRHVLQDISAISQAWVQVVRGKG